jgi:hypothetical protein
VRGHIGCGRFVVCAWAHWLRPEWCVCVDTQRDTQHITSSPLPGYLRRHHSSVPLSTALSHSPRTSGVRGHITYNDGTHQPLCHPVVTAPAQPTHHNSRAVSQHDKQEPPAEPLCVCGDVGREVIRLTHSQGNLIQGQGPYLLLTPYTHGVPHADCESPCAVTRTNALLPPGRKALETCPPSGIEPCT